MHAQAASITPINVPEQTPVAKTSFKRMKGMAIHVVGGAIKLTSEEKELIASLTSSLGAATGRLKLIPRRMKLDSFHIPSECYAEATWSFSPRSSRFTQAKSNNGAKKITYAWTE